MEDNKGMTIERAFDARREMVWRAWTEPEMVKSAMEEGWNSSLDKLAQSLQ